MIEPEGDKNKCMEKVFCSFLYNRFLNLSVFGSRSTLISLEQLMWSKFLMLII